VSGLPFVVRGAAVDESFWVGESPSAYLTRIVQSKLDAVRSRELDVSGVVLVADTIVIAPEGALMGKPADGAEAVAMLERLSGGVHWVMTGFMLGDADPRSEPAHFETVTTAVKFRHLRRGEGRAYAATSEGSDKAGGYAIQGRAAAFVERIDGSYTNVVGLPMCELFTALWELGWIGDR